MLFHFNFNFNATISFSFLSLYPSCLLFIVAFFVNLHSNIILRLKLTFLCHLKWNYVVFPLLNCTSTHALSLFYFFFFFLNTYGTSTYNRTHTRTYTYACRSDAECKLANNVILNQLNFPVACSVLWFNIPQFSYS